MYEVGQNICPKVPQGAEKLRKCGKKQHSTANAAYNQEAPQLTIRLPQQEEKGTDSRAETVKAVQPDSQTWATEPERPQQVVEEGDG